ncbi:winged helix-turn-helix domain-containing protein [Grimontia hollisae]|uniref:winged helix-turn-helix domain-containing protein n=1 Tax=Grimontia hollisae TaxID=673 RepID=UPI00165D77D8|nr:winged helix-turn-helix domain-containing protein [Grimontia hollisae]
MDNSFLKPQQYRIDRKIVEVDSPFMLDIDSQKRLKIGTHEHLVLLALCENPGKVIDKNLLLEIGWPGKFVSDSSLTQAIRNIRAYLNDDGKSQKHIKTITKKGYLLESEFVEVIETIQSPSPTSQTTLTRDEFTPENKKYNITTFFLIISITVQVIFICYQISVITFPSLLVKSEKRYPGLGFQEEYIYVYSSDFSFAEALGNDVLTALGIKEISLRKLYIMLNGETVSFSYITSDNISRNYAIKVEKNKDIKTISEIIINEIHP